MKYPRYKRDQKLSVKLKSSDCRKIKKEYKAEKNLYRLSKKWQVSRTTIKAIVNPSWAKERQIKYRYLVIAWAKEHKQSVSISTMKSRKRKKRIQPQYRKYRYQKHQESRIRKRKSYPH